MLILLMRKDHVMINYKQAHFLVLARSYSFESIFWNEHPALLTGCELPSGLSGLQLEKQE